MKCLVDMVKNLVGTYYAVTIDDVLLFVGDYLICDGAGCRGRNLAHSKGYPT